MAVEQNPFLPEEEIKELRRESPVLETEGEVVQFSPTDDGGVEVEFGDTEIEADLLIIAEQDHYANLAEFLEEDDLVVQDLLEEWQGMPDYEQDYKTSFRSVIVHFEGEEEVKKFFKLIKQNHTEKTKSIWFPEQINMDTESKRYD